MGGVFFDDFSNWALSAASAMTQAVGDAFWAYLPIVEKRQNTAYGERERGFQLYRRGRYVEFNLVWDRGTHFGLQSGAYRIDPAVHAAAGLWLGVPPRGPRGSPEAELTRRFLVRREWI